MQCGDDGRTGVYGWRKRSLYAVLLLLLVIVLANLGATLLLINTIHFNLDGLGELAITADGVQLREGGYSYVHDSLVAPRLASRPGRPLSFGGFKNLSLTVRDEAGLPLQSLEFYSAPFDSGRPVVSARASRFSVTDPRGKTLFAAAPGQVTVGVDNFKVVKGGVHFSGSVQTSTVQWNSTGAGLNKSSNDGAELMLESATRRLLVRSPAEVVLESRVSSLSASCLNDLRLNSAAGRIRMKAGGVYFPHLDSLPRSDHGYISRAWAYPDQSVPPKSYQVCTCKNGKLFISKVDGICAIDISEKQCR